MLIPNIPQLSLFFKANAHLRKRLSSQLREAICSAVSSRVRWKLCENFSSRGREKNIWHVWYFLPREVKISTCADDVRILLRRSSKLANEIALKDYKAKFSHNFRRTREETSEQTSSRGWELTHLLKCTQTFRYDLQSQGDYWYSTIVSLRPMQTDATSQNVVVCC